MFLGILLRVLQLEVSIWIYKTKGKGVWFSIRFPLFFFYSVQKLNCRNNLHEFEEI